MVYETVDDAGVHRPRYGGKLVAAMDRQHPRDLFERAAFARWQATRVSQDALQRWVDGPVASTWGIMAAARVYSIATNGFDGEPERRARKEPPHRRQVSRATAVPGSQAPCRDRYGAAQIRAWIASRRNSVTERTAWRAQIGTLVQQLARD